MSNIKIQDINQRVQYAATSSQTVFNVPFPFFENQDLQVYQNDTLLNIGTSAGEYGVTGAGSASGGVVTLVTGATSGDLITILGATPIDRTSIYSATISNLTGRDLNNDFNRDIVMLKQVWTVQNLLQLQYKPFLEVSQDIDVKRDRWLPILGASQVWAMNPAGTEIIAVDFDETASAPADARYFLAQADGGLINGVDFGALTSGLLKHSVSAGVSTPTTAIPATDYWAPGNDLTTPNPPVNGDDVTNKTYVDALVYGGIWFHSVRAASTANFASTYDNGSSGIGATLTASSNGAASLDGISLSLNDRALFKDQSNAFENGIYVVTQVGDGSNPAIYTRTTDFNEPSQIDPGDIIPATEGSTNNDTFWVQTSTVNTIGTDSIDFSLFGIKPANVVTISGAQTITGAKTFDDLTLGGDMDADSNKIINLLDPTNPQDAASKAYVDSNVGVALLAVQSFSASGTYTPTTGMKYCIVRAIAGGGGGGGADANPGATASAGNGGGSGSFSEGLFSAATIGASQTVTIGAGGTAGSAGTGGTGGVTSLGALMTTNGGTGGGQGPARGAYLPTPTVGNGGAAGSGGYNNFRGAPGGIAHAGNSGSSNNSGFGASSFYGGGGSPIVNATSPGSSTVANGAGGGGGASLTTGAAQTGGVGGGGYIEIIEFI